MIKIAPSILSADFANLGEQVKFLQEYGADLIHIDVMDGNFVPNITIGAPIIKSLRKYADIPFDVHLMINEPSRFIDDFIEAGSDIITVHYEADKHIDRTINYIKSFGIKAGIALNPGSPVSLIKDLINIVDVVLIMTVNPGFGGQKYIKYCSNKVKETKKLIENINSNVLIEVDGGIDTYNISEVTECGADIIVAGSAVFKNNKIKENITNLKRGF